MQPRPRGARSKIGSTWVENETFVSVGGAPSVALISAIVTVPALTGEVAMSSVTVAVAGRPSDTTPGASSKNTTQPDAEVAVAAGAATMFASRKFGPSTAGPPETTKFAAATPALGVPFASMTCASSTPRAAVGLTPNAVASWAR